jgi:hypothetical protein
VIPPVRIVQGILHEGDTMNVRQLGLAELLAEIGEELK